MSARMTIHDIAGFCPEEAIWKMLADVSASLLQGATVDALHPGAIVVDGSAFMLDAHQTTVAEFQAPEKRSDEPLQEAHQVWSLGAIAFYAATGHIVFGGHGSAYQQQHPAVALPTLPKKMQALTPILQRCLNATPGSRPGMQELHDLASKGLTACQGRSRRSVGVPKESAPTEKKNKGLHWPEEMTEL